MKEKTKMDRKSLVVALCTVALFLVLVSGVSAADISTNNQITVNGITVLQTVNGAQAINSSAANAVSVVAGSQMTIKVYFTSDVNDTNVHIKAEVDGETTSFEGSSPVFDVEAGHKYVEELTLNVPYDLQNQLSNDLTLSVRIDGADYSTNFYDIPLRVQRPSYNVAIESVTTPNTINAGDNLPVEVVLKNIGYNELNDVYATASISELGISEGPKWFGDLVTLDNCTNDCNTKDTVVGDIYMKLPYNVAPGVYTLQVVVQNNNVKVVQTRQIVIGNSVPDSVLVSNSIQSASAGETATYNVLIVNPTDNVKVYTITADGGATPSQSIVAVPAGSSSTVSVTASSNDQGKHTFNVSVFQGSTLVKSVPLELDVTGGAANTVVVLTIVLAIIFLVLLVVLIVLLSRKPVESKATEEFGESYY